MEDVKFEPIVYLPEVEVPTLEENEEVLLKSRAKLYRFDTTNEEAPEWKVFVCLFLCFCYFFCNIFCRNVVRVK